MLLLALLLGCPTPEVAPPPAAAEAPAPAAAPDSTCVTGCREKRMMQAVSIDQIRSDCQAECGEAPKPPL